MRKQKRFFLYISFILGWLLQLGSLQGQNGPAFALHSVLESGTWIKMGVGVTGVFRISYADLSAAGIPVGSIDPRNIRIYGNGGGMLPEANSAPRIDDLRENAIFVYGEEDGKFDPGDFILFYGESPNDWLYNQSDHLFHHRKNRYTDYNYYFLTADLGQGKRITAESSTTQPATHYINTFNDRQFYEKDDLNLIKSGREWFDQDLFDITPIRHYSFSLPNIDEGSPISLTVAIAARSISVSSSFRVYTNGEQLMTVSIPSVSGDYLDYYAKQTTRTDTYSTTTPVLDIELEYLKPTTGAVGWLNYIEVNAIRKLIMSGYQMPFRSVSGAGKNNITEFTLTSSGQNLIIWDVTDGGEIRNIQASHNGNQYVFRIPTDTLKEFITWDGTSFFSPEFVGRINNQDLHGTSYQDYIIISHPAFLQEAERLASFHRERNNLSVLVTTTDKVYNEFSSGAQDITAIRDFMKMLYDRSTLGNYPRYLLLFGDASYDYKNRIQNNTNYVPAFESLESLYPVDSYVTDDYFVILEDNEGQNASGDLDAGVGRLPVMTLEEARQAVDKIIYYRSNSDSVKNDWRTVVCFVADDQDEGGNLFINDSEDLASLITTSHPVYNIDKIYLDAYTQVSTPGGNRYPEVNDAINKRVEKGALIINYVGHGGEVGWSHERVLEVPDIKEWKNLNNMPVFVTATCEFSRYDDPERISAGEYAFLNPNGGGIALFTTTRLTYAGSNFVLTSNFFTNAFQRINGNYHKMGDLIMLAKNSTGTSSNSRKFVLLGDPALQIAYPDLIANTTSIITKASMVFSDTLKALQEVTIEGEIVDLEGNPIPEFQGTIFPTVLDKPSEVYTNGNDGSPKVKFLLYKNPIYKGTVQVDQGTFSFSFIVPKDISYRYGNGRISYYAKNAATDAAGYDESIIVGGYNNTAIPDENGPAITLYMNDRNFKPEGITDQRPVLLVDVMDESGINTVGNGIGHDITAILDNQTTNPIILNEYYVSDLNTFTSGVITYPLGPLADGYHSLTVKVWDVYNNSTEATLGFIVISSSEIAIEHLINFPNPFRYQTIFSFETNQTGKNLEIEIRIYSLYGLLVKTIRDNILATGYRMISIPWDGTTDDGSKIGSGTYICELKLTLPDGTFTRETSKLVVLRN